MGRTGRTENLNPVKTEEEAREKGRRGGIASGKARKAKKEFKQLAEIALAMSVDSPKALARLKAEGVKQSDATQKMMCVLGMITAAKNGNVKAFEKLQELTGELGASGDEMAKLDDILSGLDRTMND